MSRRNTSARLVRRRETQAAWARKKYRENPARGIAYVQSRAEETRKRIYAIKARPCMDCGNSFPPECMDFDHRDGEKKLFGISLKLTISWQRLEAEIAKCDIVCANCHRIRTTVRRQHRSVR